MKKFVIIILLILPIFLMVTISLVGQVLATITYINVESVAFVDELEKDITYIKIGKAQQKTLIVQVLPSLANNKKLKFVSLDESVAEVDNKGVVTGISYGYTTLVVESVDGKKTDRLTINVTDENVTGVDIELENKELYLYQEYTLLHTVYPFTALDKKVNWTSSNPEYVEVKPTGAIVAKKVTEPGMTVTITATTRDGEYTDTCEVTVLPYLLVFLPHITKPGTVYTCEETTLDLMSFINYDSTLISEDDIQFSLDMGQDYATINNGTLNFNTEVKEKLIVRLVCKAINENVNVEIKINLMYNNE